MVRRVDHTEINIKVVDEGGCSLESVQDIKSLTLPSDWSFTNGELFDDVLHAEWTHDQEGTIVITPYPTDNYNIHNVSYKNESEFESSNQESWKDSVDKAINYMADNTTDGTFRILERDVETIQTFQEYTKEGDLVYTSENISSVPEIIDAKDMVNVDCQTCGEDSMFVEHQEMSTNADSKITVRYRCICPTCSSITEIEETRNEVW